MAELPVEVIEIIAFCLGASLAQRKVSKRRLQTLHVPIVDLMRTCRAFHSALSKEEIWKEMCERRVAEWSALWINESERGELYDCTPKLKRMQQYEAFVNAKKKGAGGSFYEYYKATDETWRRMMYPTACRLDAKSIVWQNSSPHDALTYHWKLQKSFTIVRDWREVSIGEYLVLPSFPRRFGGWGAPVEHPKGAADQQGVMQVVRVQQLEHEEGHREYENTFVVVRCVHTDEVFSFNEMAPALPLFTKCIASVIAIDDAIEDEYMLQLEGRQTSAPVLYDRTYTAVKRQLEFGGEVKVQLAVWREDVFVFELCGYNPAELE